MKLLPKRNCLHCKKSIKRKHGRAKYCSNGCRVAAFREFHPERKGKRISIDLGSNPDFLKKLDALAGYNLKLFIEKLVQKEINLK